MMRRRAMRSKTKGDVVSRFPHGAIALVVFGAKRHRPRVVALRLRHRFGGITCLKRKERTYGRLRAHGPWNEIIPSHVPLAQKKCRDLPVVTRFILHTLGRRTVSKVVVA